MPKLVDILTEADQHTTLSASGLVTLGKGRLSLFLFTAGSGNSSATIYDGRDNAGIFKFRLEAVAQASNSFDMGYRIEFQSGIYVEISGSGSQLFLSWQPIH